MKTSFQRSPYGVTDAGSLRLVVRRRWLELSAIVAASWLCPHASYAAPPATLTVLYSFSGKPGDPYVARARLTQGFDGNLYGTTLSSENFQQIDPYKLQQGGIFRIDAHDRITVLRVFMRTDNMALGGVVQVANGKMFGAGRKIVEISRSGTVRDIADDSLPPHSYCGGLTVGSDQFLYGAICAGSGPYSYGALFKMSPDGDITVLHTFGFGDGSGIQDPFAANLLEDSDRGYFGTTPEGGRNGGGGTLFKMAADGNIVVLFTFKDGGYPVAGLAKDSEGNIYGATLKTNHHGSIFKRNVDGTVQTLHQFLGKDGEAPLTGPIVARDGNLYGTTSRGGLYGDGVLYRLTRDGVFTILISFDGRNGTAPSGGVIEGRNGSLYGTTETGGRFGGGVVYRVDLEKVP